MTASRKPVVSWTVPQAPLTDANGHITWAWIKWFQGIQQTINSAFDQQGNFDGNLGVDVSIVSRSVTLLTILQNIDDTGVVTAAGIDFARPYLNKDTDHINDGLGNPLAGGRVAYAAMVGSGPHAGQILVFDGSTWQPHAKATTIPKAAHEWLDSYDDATGTFTASQPSFVDIIGTISPSQLPVATTSTVGVVKPDGTTITVDPDGTVHLANSGVTPGTYTNATVSVNAQGQVTAASSGSAGSSSYAPVQILQKNGGSGNAFSVAFPNNNLVGSAIVACVDGFAGSPTLSDTQGNTYTSYAAAGSSAIFVALNVKGGANTVNVNGSGGFGGNATIYELSNVAQVEASTAGATGSSVSTLATGSASSVYPFEFVLMTAFTTAGTLSNANSWSSGASASSIFGNTQDFYTTVATPGSVSNTANSTGSGTMYTGFVILRPIMSVPNPMTAKGDLIVGGTSGIETRVGIGTSGQVLTVSSGTAAWANATGGGAYINITGSCTITGATVSGNVAVVGSAVGSVTISSIPNIYTSLKIIATYNSTDAGANDFCGQFNADTGNNYIWQTGYSGGSTVAGIGSGALTSHVVIGAVPGTPSGSSAGSLELTIPNYANTTFNKNVISISTRYNSATQDLEATISGRWINTAAISSIKIFSNGGGNIIAGSIFSIYGIL